MPSQPMHLPAQMPVTICKVSLNLQYVACHSLLSLKSLRRTLCPPRKLILQHSYHGQMAKPGLECRSFCSPGEYCNRSAARRTVLTCRAGLSGAQVHSLDGTLDTTKGNFGVPVIQCTIARMFHLSNK